jgi:integrase
MLQEQVTRFPTANGLVFSAPGGGPVRAGNFRKRVFQPAAASVGLPELHVHDLRHVAASQLAADGASAVEIAARLGHASPAITQRVYLHLLESRDQRLADLQEERWREAGRT